MKRIIISCVIFAALIISLWIYLRVSGLFNTYEVTSKANEPALQVGQHIMSSNFKKPKRFDFITFDVNGVLVVQRLCGLPGDRLQLKNGELYINEQLVTADFDTKHRYSLTQAQSNKLIAKGLLSEDEVLPSAENDLQADLADAIAQKEGLSNKRLIEKPGVRDEQIGQHWNNDYNKDNFGPVLVPDDCYFVLGDNRRNAYDSRYLGFIQINRYKSTVLRVF